MSKLPQRIPNVFHQPESSRSFIRRGLAICSMPLTRRYFALASDTSGDRAFGRHPEERSDEGPLFDCSPARTPTLARDFAAKNFWSTAAGRRFEDVIRGKYALIWQT